MCAQETCQDSEICQICKNQGFIAGLSEASMRFLFLSIILTGLLVWIDILDSSYFTLAFLVALLPFLYVQKISISGLFRGLEPKHAIYPALYRTYRANDVAFYHEALSKAIKARNGGENINHPMIRFGLAQAILFSNTSIPSDWDSTWAKLLGYSSGNELKVTLIEEFLDDLEHALVPGGAIGALPEVTRTIREMEKAELAKRIVDVIHEAMKKIEAKPLDFYADEYLKDVFLAEEDLKEIGNWDKEIAIKVDEIFAIHEKNFVPPKVPKNQREAMQIMVEENARRQRLLQATLKGSPTTDQSQTTDKTDQTR